MPLGLSSVTSLMRLWNCQLRLRLFGIPSVNWLDNVQMSMPTLIIFGVWTSLAFNIIILLAGLRNIDEEHFKIAKCLAPQTAKFSDVLRFRS